eukprot:503359_1
MATQSEQTGTDEGENEAQSLKDLSTDLKNRKLTYIMDIIHEQDEECNLQDLIKWQRKDIAQLIDEINADTSNQHQIKVMHKNRFLSIVEEHGNKIRAEQDQTQQIKLMFVSKQEQEAIDSIEDYKLWIHSEGNKLSQSLQALDQNVSQNKNTLASLCECMKREIVKKQEKMAHIIDKIYETHLKTLHDKRNATQKATDMVNRIDVEYKLLFRDETLQRAERINKLVAMKADIERSKTEMKQFQDVVFNMEVALNCNILNTLKLKSIVLANTGISVKDINVTVEENEIVMEDEKVDDKLLPCAEYIMKWSPQHKKDGIQLAEDDTKAVSNSGNRSVRCANPIKKGMMVKLKFTFFCDKSHQDIAGNCIFVVSEKHCNFQDCSIPFYKGLQMDAYGMDIGTARCIYEPKDGKKSQHFTRFTCAEWGTTRLQTGKEEVFYMLVDFRTHDTCCLSFYNSNMKLLAPKDAQYSMQLPERGQWYPAMGFWNAKCWCKIQNVTK